jgi:CRISPR-associated protein Csd2
VTVVRVHAGSVHAVGDPATHNWPAARAWSDYRVDVNHADLPTGIEIIER